ncbi:hypothetical protein [Halodesulfovibrio sp. MK-HDV]|jgi:hypothetical protein|uniref:hypothetical protein n=1 Tax=Halodesulfovibrio sp. MK-HDV TaxID=2599925 RepID=UPI001367DEA7|nr:hypothetical protein [Halodesulfovibrio sp. MK-HDV]KAF1076305.1 hypothetical protein MKHDV_01326 [Halodesulfovibrio sp. MK-HDV]
MMTVEDILSQVTNWLENPNVELHPDVIVLAKDLQNTCLHILKESSSREGVNHYQAHTEQQFFLFQELLATIHPSLFNK